MLTISELASESYVMPRTKAELMRDYKRLAKSADARLRALEGARYKKGFEAITQYAYKRAMHDIGRGDRGRFDVSVKNKTYNEIVGMMNDVRRFYQSPTSTITGTRAVYVNNTKAFNDKFSTNFTWQQLAVLFDKNTGLYEKITNSDNKLGSPRIVRAIAIMQNNKKKVLNAIDKNGEINIVNEDKPALQTLKYIINSYPDDVKKLLKVR